MIIFVDTETTGLSPAKDKLLEIAVIVTDDAFVEVARFHRVTNEATLCDLFTVNPFVLKMHVANGLWNESLLARAEEVGNLDSVDQDLVKFLDETRAGLVVPDSALWPLAGNTVSFDREFWKQHLPRSFGLVHYRNLDVTSLNEIAKRFWPDVYAKRPRQDPNGNAPAHRATADIEYSLWTARYYAKAMGPAILDRGQAAMRVSEILNANGAGTEHDQLVNSLVAAVLDPPMSVPTEPTA